VLCSPGVRAFAGLVQDVLDHTEVVLQGRCGWTKSVATTKVELAAGANRTEEFSLSSGESVQWSVGVAAYDILVQARFLEKKANKSPKFVLSERQLGDAYQALQGSWICGHFTAPANGTLQVQLNNTCAPLPSSGVLLPAALAAELSVCCVRPEKTVGSGE
jgi:hypothetical protein